LKRWTSGSSAGSSNTRSESRVRGVDSGESEVTAAHNPVWTLVRTAVDFGELDERKINESLNLSRGLG
jgi:hypothetical protein